METTPVGSHAIYNITSTGTSVLEITNAINEHGINGIMLMNTINSCGTKQLRELTGATSWRSVFGYFVQKIGLDSERAYKVKTDCPVTFK